MINFKRPKIVKLTTIVKMFLFFFFEKKTYPKSKTEVHNFNVSAFQIHLVPILCFYSLGAIVRKPKALKYFLRGTTRFVRSISPENLRKTFQKYSLCNVLMFEFTFIEVYFFIIKLY